MTDGSVIEGAPFVSGGANPPFSSRGNGSLPDSRPGVDEVPGSRPGVDEDSDSGQKSLLLFWNENGLIGGAPVVCVGRVGWFVIMPSSAPAAGGVSW